MLRNNTERCSIHSIQYPPVGAYAKAKRTVRRLKKLSAKFLKIASQPAPIGKGNRWGLWSKLAVAIISVGLTSLGAWDVLEQQSYTLVHHVRKELQGAPAWDNRIVIIAIAANHNVDAGSVSRRLQIQAYENVIEGQVDVSGFQHKTVLADATLTGVDPMRSPFNQNLPVAGVHLHTAAINNLLNRSFLQQPPAWQILVLLLGLATVGSHLLRRQGIYRRLAIVVCFPLGWGALAYSGLVMGWWLPVAAPIITVMLSALAIQIREQQEKQQLMELLSMNLSAGTAELIWRHKGVILQAGELAAQTLTATVLFMDIRGFTGIAETLPSHQLLPWLNQYFETMTDCIMEHGGMVDKYIGDSIMAVFGAPIPRKMPDDIKADAIAALNAAIEMHDRLRSLNLQLSAQQLPIIEFGIGIHTGSLIGGTVGSRHRLNYSLFGDTVNVAARLEAMTKTLPASAPFKLLLSAETYHCAQPSFPVQLFKSTQLRGRASTTDIYTPSPFSAALEPFSAALDPYSCPIAAPPSRCCHRSRYCRHCPTKSRSPQTYSAQNQ